MENISSSIWNKIHKLEHQNIFTYDEKLLKLNPDIFKFTPAGGIWIGEDFGGGSFGIKKKTKLVSIVSSKKKSCRLHRYRLKLAKKLLKHNEVDVYGLDDWVHINQTLDDYMFSIIIENNSIENYFTEKLLNCFAVGTIPIYLGCTNINKFFDMAGIIPIDTWTNINKLLSNLSRQEYDIRSEAIKENLERCRQYEIIEDYIYNNYFEK